MAPRKRTTKKNNPKTAKLEAFLADFDGEGRHFLVLKATGNNISWTESRVEPTELTSNVDLTSHTITERNLIVTM